MPRPMRRSALWCGLLLLPAAAQAAGGAHVVDDAAIAPPGEGQLETWGGVSPAGGWLAVAAPGVTFRALPQVEWTASLAVAGAGSETATEALFQAKWLLRPTGPAQAGLALSAGTGANLATGTHSGWFMTAIATLPVSQALLVNANLGLARANGAGDLLWGIGADWQVADPWMLTAEVFGAGEGRVGAQGGVRRLLADGRMDLDLLVGHRIADAPGAFITLGLTLRF